MIEKTNAVVLSVQRFSETSHLVTWLAEDGEKLVTLVKGACRRRSLFLGQYDSFQTCELVFYRRERHGLHIAKETTPLESREALRTDWRAFGCASYICGLAADIALQGSSQPSLYEHVVETLDHLANRGATRALPLWFELRLQGILGWPPKLDRCVVCTKAVTAETATRLSIPLGGIVCATCDIDSVALAEPVQADTLAILRRWQADASPRTAYVTRLSLKQLLVCRAILGKLLRYHMELMPEGRRIAWEMASAGKSAVGGEGRTL